MLSVPSVVQSPRNWLRSRRPSPPGDINVRHGNHLCRWQIGFDRRGFANGPEPRRAPGVGSRACQRAGAPRGPALARAHHGHDTDSRIVKEPASRRAGILSHVDDGPGLKDCVISSLHSKQSKSHKILYLYIAPCFATPVHSRPFRTKKTSLHPHLAEDRRLAVLPVRGPWDRKACRPSRGSTARNMLVWPTLWCCIRVRKRRNRGAGGLTTINELLR